MNLPQYSMDSLLKQHDVNEDNAAFTFLYFNLWHLANRNNWKCVPVELRQDYVSRFLIERVQTDDSKIPDEHLVHIRSSSTWQRTGDRWAVSNEDVNTARAYLLMSFRNFTNDQYKRWQKACSPEPTATKSSADILNELAHDYMNHTKETYMTNDLNLLDHLNNFINLYTKPEDRTIAQYALIQYGQKNAWEKTGLTRRTFFRRKAAVVKNFRAYLATKGYDMGGK